MVSEMQRTLGREMERLGVSFRNNVDNYNERVVKEFKGGCVPGLVVVQ